MKENRAATATFARADIPIHYNAGIVNVIIAPHLLMAWLKRKMDRTIVIGVVGRIAPAIELAHTLQRQRRERPLPGIATTISIKQPHGRKWRRTVTFALESADSPLAKRTFEHQIASSKQAARFMAGLCPYLDDANSAVVVIFGQACLRFLPAGKVWVIA